MIPLLIGTTAQHPHVFDDWFHSAHIAATNTGLACHFVVACEPQSGIHEYLDRYYCDYVIVLPTTGSRTEIKNTILRSVRGIRPDLFLYAHEQIMLREGVIHNLIENLDYFDVVGARVQGCYTYALKKGNGSWRSKDSDGVFYVDAVMMLQFMTPKAYRVDYHDHPMNEDFGYSVAAIDEGIRLGWDGRLVNRYVYP